MFPIGPGNGPKETEQRIQPQTFTCDFMTKAHPWRGSRGFFFFSINGARTTG